VDEMMVKSNYEAKPGRQTDMCSNHNSAVSDGKLVIEMFFHGLCAE
jgi:hypothetical protein